MEDKHINPNARWMKGKTPEYIAHGNAVRAFVLAMRARRLCKNPEEREAMIPKLHALAAAAGTTYYPD